MQRKYLTPAREVVEVDGSVFYQQKPGAWNTLRLKRQIYEEYPLLKQKAKRISYRMALCRTQKQMDDIMAKVRREEIPMPLLLWFSTED